MLAIQENNQVSWVHQDPVTKSQRLTNSAGAIISWVELDPWGGETGKSNNSQKQPHRYTSYERDTNGGDEAMFRRYESKWQRFAQPDPYDGSYDLTDPQSFNRYSYVQNDPVNFVDPTGLLPNIWGTLDGYGAGHGFGGWGGGYSGGNGWGRDPRPGLREIRRDEEDLHPLGRVIGVSEFYFVVSHHFNSLFWDSSFFYDYRPQEPKPAPRPTPVKNPEQEGFNNCARRAYREFRKNYFKDGGKALLGGGLMLTDILLFRGLGGLGVKVGKNSIAGAMRGFGKKLGPTTSLGSLTLLQPLGGDLVASAVKDGNQNQANLNAELRKCEQQYPNANHSGPWMNF